MSRINMLHAAIRAAMKNQTPTDALTRAVTSWWADTNYYGDAGVSQAATLVAEVERELYRRIS